MRHFIRGLYSFVIMLLLAGCTMAPGLYVDNISVDTSAQPAEQQLGANVSVFPVTAELVERLRNNLVVEEEAKRKMSHALIQENHHLKERYEYRVGNTDVLSIITWGHPELNIVSSSVRQGQAPLSVESLMLTADAPSLGHEIDSDGNIFYPYIGLVKVSGETLAEIRQQITKLMNRFIPDPYIDIGISQYRSQHAYVVGEVENAITIPITQKPVEIIDALTKVGGLTTNADTRNAFMIRDGRRYHVDIQSIWNGDMTQNYILRDKDMLVIPDNRYNSIFVIGEFNKNTQLQVPPSRFYSLADAILDPSVGGFSPDVDPRRVFVFRYPESEGENPAPQYPEVYHLNIDSAEKMLLAAKFPLKPRDIIYAAPSSLVRWNRVMLQLLPTIQAIYDPVRTYWFIDDTTTNRNRNIDENL